MYILFQFYYSYNIKNMIQSPIRMFLYIWIKIKLYILVIYIISEAITFLFFLPMSILYYKTKFS